MQSSCLALSDWIRSPKQPHSPHRMETSQKETIFSFSRPSPPASWALPIVSIKQLMSLSGTCQDSWGPVRKKSEPISSETQCPPSSKAFPWHRVCGQSSAPWQDRRWSLVESPFQLFHCLSREDLWALLKATGINKSGEFRGSFLILTPPSYLVYSRMWL